MTSLGHRIIVRFLCFFLILLHNICGNYSFLEVFKSYSNDYIHIYRRTQEHNGTQWDTIKTILSRELLAWIRQWAEAKLPNAINIFGT